jgi:hypothetical protein
MDERTVAASLTFEEVMVSVLAVPPLEDGQDGKIEPPRA